MSPKSSPDMAQELKGDFRLLSRTLSPDQLLRIRDAIGSNRDIPIVPLATRLNKQLDAIRRLAENGNRAELQAVARGATVDKEAAQSPGKAGLEIGFASRSAEARHTWKEADEEELARLLEDGAYRRRVLGTADIDYRRLGGHFSRSESAIRKKCWSMAMRDQIENRERRTDDGGQVAKAETTAEAPAKQTTPGNPSQTSAKRKWSDEENEEMKKFVESEAYRIGQGVQEEGSKTIKWGALAHRFKNCKAGQAQKKFQALNSIARSNGGVVKKDRKQNRKHHQKKLAYKWMVVTVMRNFADMRGTAPDIFAAIEAHDDFRSQLDTSIAPGTQQVPRWRTQVRKTLSAEKIFINTGTKVDKETVWELDIATVVDLVADNPKQRIGDLEKVVPMVAM